MTNLVEETELRTGQIWKGKRNKPGSTFTILKMWRKQYTDGNSALRVKGVLVTGVDGNGTHLCDLDARSLRRMFPYVLFEPEREPVEIGK